jgi:hypothetical protein
MLAIDFFKSISTWAVIVSSAFLIYACSYKAPETNLKKRNKPKLESAYILKEPFEKAEILLSPYTDRAGKTLKTTDVFYVVKHYGPWAYGYNQEEYWGYVDKNKLTIK